MPGSEYYEVRQIEPTHQAIWRGFLVGIASGLGAVIGATIVLGALLFFLSRLDFIPFIGGYIADITTYVNQHNIRTR